MSEKIISIRSGNEKFTMSVTEESYEAWKDSASEEAGMARAGSWLPAPMTRYHIFSVYTAVSRRTAEFFYSTHFYLFSQQITKGYNVFMTGAPGILRVRFFCAFGCRHGRIIIPAMPRQAARRGSRPVKRTWPGLWRMNRIFRLQSAGAKKRLRLIPRDTVWYLTAGFTTSLPLTT